ncbi:MAG: hypothetical protein Q9214_003427 [Letrouitia sp. 1 TL-2023]
MLDFMDYVQIAFYEASHWNLDNSYGTLTATARSLLDFPTPLGLRLHVSSLSTPNFATSYTLASTGLLSGSLSYLYTSLALPLLPSASRAIHLQSYVPGSYRQLTAQRPPDEPQWWEIWHRGRRIDRRDALLYGRLFLPRSTLEALYLRRMTPTTQIKVSCVSDSRLPNGGTVLACLQQDTGKWSAEYIYSTDSALLGVRGLYNFGPDPRIRRQQQQDEGSSSISASPPLSADSKPAVGPIPENDDRAPISPPLSPPATESPSRFSAGCELYYGLLNKSGGMSIGLRFATLPAHSGFPYTMTLTLNPLMGSLSSTYSVRAGRSLSLSTRFDFNVYSYESEVLMGMELWRLKQGGGERLGRATNEQLKRATPKEEEEDYAAARPKPERAAAAAAAQREEFDASDATSGCLKAKIDHRGAIGVLWQGRVKELVYSLGAGVDLRGGKDMITGVGVEVQYSS